MIWEGKTDSAMKSSGSGTFTAISRIIHLDREFYSAGTLSTTHYEGYQLSVYQSESFKLDWSLSDFSLQAILTAVRDLASDNAKFISRWSEISVVAETERVWGVGLLLEINIHCEQWADHWGDKSWGEELYILAVKRNIHLTKHLESTGRSGSPHQGDNWLAFNFVSSCFSFIQELKTSCGCSEGINTARCSLTRYFWYLDCRAERGELHQLQSKLSDSERNISNIL